MPPAFHFDLSCPFSYLAMERIERLLGDVDWVPTDASVLRRWDSRPQTDALRAHAERLAGALRLPLEWPERFPAPARGAMRAAAHAAEVGAGGRFALAASRLAFCGGFDLDDPEILAEASAAAGVPLDSCLVAAGEAERDRSLRAAAHSLLGAGVRRLPALRIGGQWFHGERALADGAAQVRARAVTGRPLAPVC
jgi:2-hydroxychromene-2-carboxylate isomerase